MSLDSLLTQTAAITNRTESGTDEYNNPIESDAASNEVPCLLQQLNVSEIVQGSDRRITDKRLFLLPDVSIDSQSKVTVDGVEYEVLGEPDVLEARGLSRHQEVIVRRIEG